MAQMCRMLSHATSREWELEMPQSLLCFLCMVLYSQLFLPAPAFSFPTRSFPFSSMRILWAPCLLSLLFSREDQSVSCLEFLHILSGELHSHFETVNCLSYYCAGPVLLLALSVGHCDSTRLYFYWSHNRGRVSR